MRRSATPITDYYLTNPIARASETMAKCSREFVHGAHQDGGGIGDGADPASCKASWDCPIGWAWFLSQAVFILVICLVLMLSVAAVILADRKIWAAVQMRRGPNVVGPFGLLQTIADAVKFLLKEVIIPAGANKVIFLLAPLVSVMLAFIAWAVIPFDKGWVIADINVGILYLFAVSSLGVYGIVMAGWASNSKYAFLSALRARGPDGVLRSLHRLCDDHRAAVRRLAEPVGHRRRAGDQRRAGLLHWNVFSILFPMLVIFFVSSLAETQRPPFDLLEAESRTGGGLLRGIFLRRPSCCSSWPNI